MHDEILNYRKNAVAKRISYTTTTNDQTSNLLCDETIAILLSKRLKMYLRHRNII